MDSELLQLGGSLVAVLLLVGLTWLLGFRQQARLESPEEAAELIRLAPGGFEPVAVALDAKGRAAIARDRQGRLLVLVPHGNHFVARPLPEDCRPANQDGTLHISCEGRPLTLALGPAAGDWTTADSAVN
ncbi:hypothetical protein [Aurantiacibacter gilvus]|uniref:NusG domain-containing protein n=1 Tax=Aurantiacibacter gilvus TaxID=3139141 RepID=A0ABU9II21_9SPHN